MTAYNPIKDSSGRVIGALQVGTKKSTYSKTLASILKRSLFVTLAGILIIGFVVYAALNHLTDELQQMATRRKLLLESTGEGIYAVDLEGRCSFINHTGAEILGYSVEELIGKEIHPLIYRTPKENMPYPLSEKIRRSDEIFWRKDGTSIPVRYLSSPMVHKGITQGAVVAFNDITQRKRAEAETIKKN